MSIAMYLGFLATCAVLVAVPGPTATLIAANSLRHGLKAGLLNVAGTQLGLATMIAVVAVGLAPLVASMEHWFDLVRLAGAAYLVWLGWKLLTGRDGLGAERAARRPRLGFFMQGYMVLMSNPKALLLFGALVPQFINPSAPYLPQIALMGATAMVCGIVSDGAYALLFARAGHLLSARHLRAVSRGSGAILIGGGLWLALARGR